MVFKNNVFMAPLAGVTNKAFREFIRQFEPGFMFTEMISLSALTHDFSRIEDYIDLPAEREDTGIQVIGNEPEHFENIASELNRLGVQWLDINLGCSVPRVKKQKCGSFLLRNHEICRKIFRAVRSAFEGICSVKIRAGWDRASLNYHQITGIAFEEGLDVVFFHPRTASDGFNSPAEWGWVKELKKDFPGRCIFGNGDLITVGDIATKWTDSNANGVLLARGAMKAPWIFQQVHRYYSSQDRWEPSLQQKIDYLMQHLDCLIKTMGEARGVIEMRKFMGWYLAGSHGIRELRTHLPFIKTRKDVVRFVQIVYNMILI